MPLKTRTHAQSLMHMRGDARTHARELRMAVCRYVRTSLRIGKRTIEELLGFVKVHGGKRYILANGEACCERIPAPSPAAQSTEHLERDGGCRAVLSWLVGSM